MRQLGIVQVVERGRSTLTALLVLFALAFPSRTAAQAVYGSIAGTVTDESGGVLPGVTVTITSIERNTVDSVVTNESGYFTKERMLPGTYSVKAELTGFKAAVVPSVVVSVDTQTPLTMKLAVGQLTESVEVTGGSPLLRTDRADVASSFDRKQLTDLPVIDRNFTKFILLTPGTQQLGWQHAASENPQGSVQTMVNGQHFSGTGYQLDGTENRDPILGIIVVNPNLDAIGETKITSQNYDAEFGQAIAGVVSVQTKSGSNQYHGSAFGFWSGDNFQARNPYTQFQADPVTGKFIPDTSKKQFGGTFGGKIIEDKTFFFGAYQGQRTNQGGSQLLTVPTEAARAGDLSAYGVDIFDPAAGPPASRPQFAGNVIPANRLSPQALNILKLLPTPNTPGTDNGTRNNYVANGVETFDADQYDVRVDHRIDNSSNLFGRYSLANFNRNGPTAFGQGGGPALVSLGGVSDVRNQSLALGYDKTLSPTLLMDVRFGWFRYHVNVTPFDFGTTPSKDAGIPGLNLDTTFTSGLSAFFINDGSRAFQMGSGLGVNRCNCPLDEDEKQWQIVGNVTKIWNNHTLKFGADVRRAYNLRVPSDSHRAGELNFNSDNTRGPSGGGLALATFLLGNVSTFNRYVSSSTDAQELQWRHFYYAQDTWRATPKLTLNYGLRLDVINPQTVNAAGNGGWFDLDTARILVGGVGGIDLAGNVKNKANWAPRVGAAYQWDEKTVIRAGFGRSYDIGVFGSVFGHSVTQNLPVLANQSLTGAENFDTAFNLAQGPEPAPVVAVGADGTFLLPPNVTPHTNPRTQKLPAVNAFNVMVQRQLSDTLSVEAGYVGNRGTQVFAGDGPEFNINQPTIQGFAQGVSRNDRTPFYSGIKTTQLGLGGAFGLSQGINYFCNCATNSYDALQTKLNKRFSGGYQISANYTFQKAKGHNDSYFLWDPNLNYGVQGWDRTHIFNLTLVWEIPFGKGQKWGGNSSNAMDAILGGWQFNATHTIQSGVPFDVSYNDAGADRDTGPNRPNLIGNAEGPKTTAQWFNAAPIGDPNSAFGRPAIGTFGNMPYNMLRGPYYRRTDAGLFKHIKVGGSKDLEIRIEAVNFFNVVNLGQPDATIGVPGNPNNHAGVIDSTAYGNSDPQRNFQFGAKFTF
jgi:hypothetical protein